MTSLAFAAYYQGRAAAETYRREGSEHPPALAATVPPVSLTQWLLKSADQPTDQDVQTVTTEWTRGVNDVWGGESDD